MHICDVTHSYVWCDTLTCVEWLIHMFDVTHVYVWRDSFICVTWLIHRCRSAAYCSPPVLCRVCACFDSCGVVTYSYMGRDSFTCLTWLVHVCDVTHALVWRDVTYSCLWLDSFVFVSYLCVQERFIVPPLTSFSSLHMLRLRWVVAVCCSVLRCDVVCCSVLQRVVLCCSWVVHVTCVHMHNTVQVLFVELLQCDTLCCSVL